MFVQFENKTEKYNITVNSMQVTYFQPWMIRDPDKGTTIYLADGRSINVQENYDTVAARFGGNNAK